MIISRRTAIKLIKSGSGHCVGHVVDNDRRYAIIEDWQEQTTHHTIDEHESIKISKEICQAFAWKAGE